MITTHVIALNVWCHPCHLPLQLPPFSALHHNAPPPTTNLVQVVRNASTTLEPLVGAILTRSQRLNTTSSSLPSPRDLTTPVVECTFVAATKDLVATPPFLNIVQPLTPPSYSASMDTIINNIPIKLHLSDLCALSPQVTRRLLALSQKWSKHHAQTPSTSPPPSTAILPPAPSTPPSISSSTTPTQDIFALSPDVVVYFSGAKVADIHAPKITVVLEGIMLTGAIIDGGSGVNILPESTRAKVGLPLTDPPPFVLRLADQRTVHPLGLVKGAHVTINNISFTMNFVVMDMEPTIDAYPLLIISLFPLSFHHHASPLVLPHHTTLSLFS